MSSSKSRWQPAAFIKAHDADIRCINFIPKTNYLITGSRDKKCHIYDLNSSSDLSPIAILHGHTHYIQTIKSTETSIFTGSTDNFLRKFDWSEIVNEIKKGGGEIITVENKIIFNDHTEAIVAIDVSDKFIATASWDKTAKIWKKSNLNEPGSGPESKVKSSLTLSGHEAAVWDVKFIKKDYLLTASADKSIFLWSLKQKGAKVVTYSGHTDCVRSLLVFENEPQDTFFSTGNDGTIKLWNTESGEKISSVQAHANYCYSITGRSSDSTTFSCGEDASLLIYNPKTNETNNFELPCISAWDCDNNENLSAVGTNRGELFIFTDCEKLIRPTAEADFETAQQEFISEKKKAASAKKENSESGMSDSDLAKIPGAEVLDRPGKKEGFVQMVRPDKNTKQVDVYQWSSGSWNLVGQAMSGPSESKKLYDVDGKYYDRIFDVNADSRPGMTLTLPYNYTENPWKTAQKFIEDNNLDIEELEVIVRFITENIPEEKRSIYLDKASEEVAGDKSNSTMTDNGSGDTGAAANLKNFKYLPETNCIIFDNVPPMDKLLSKLKQTFNDSISEESYKNISNISVLIDLLNDPKVTDGVESNKIFPLLDLFRIGLANADEQTIKINLDKIVLILETLSAAYCFGSSTSTNESLILKCINNFIVRLDKSCYCKSNVRKFLTNVVFVLCSHNFQESLHVQTILSGVTVILNFFVNVLEFWDPVTIIEETSMVEDNSLNGLNSNTNINSLSENLELESNNLIGSLLEIFEKGGNQSGNQILENDQIVLRIFMILGTIFFHVESKDDDITSQLLQSIVLSNEKFLTTLNKYKISSGEKEKLMREVCEEVAGFLE